MRGRINIILIVAVVFGLVAAWGTFQYLKQMEKTYKSSGKFVAVAIAKSRIPARSVINDQMVEFTEIPSNYVNPASLGNPGDIVGKVSRTDIYPGEQIIRNIQPQRPGRGTGHAGGARKKSNDGGRKRCLRGGRNAKARR